MFDLHAVVATDSTTYCFGSYGAARARVGTQAWVMKKYALPDTLDVRAAARNGNSMLLVSADGSVAIVDDELNLQHHQRHVHDILSVRTATFAAAACGPFTLALHGRHATAYDRRSNTPVNIIQPSTAQFDVMAFAISPSQAVLLYQQANDHPAMIIRATAQEGAISFDTLAIGPDVSARAVLIDTVTAIISFNRTYSEATTLNLVTGEFTSVHTDPSVWLADIPPITVLSHDGRPRGVYSPTEGMVLTLWGDTVFTRTTMPRGHALPEDLVRNRSVLSTDHEGAFILPQSGGGLFSSNLRFGYVSPMHRPQRLLRAATTPFGKVVVHSATHLSAILDGATIADDERHVAYHLTSTNGGRHWSSIPLPSHVQRTLGAHSTWSYQAHDNGVLLASESNDTLFVWHYASSSDWSLRHAIPAQGRPLHITGTTAIMLDAGTLYRVDLATLNVVNVGPIAAQDVVSESWGGTDTFALVGREGIVAWSDDGGRTMVQATPGCADGLLNGGTFGLEADSLWCSVASGNVQRIPIGVVRGTIRRGGVLNGSPVYYTGPSRIEYSRAALLNTTTLTFDSSTVVRRRPPATFNPEFHALVQGAPGIAVRQTNGVIDVVTDAPLSRVDEKIPANQRTPHRAVWQVLEVHAEVGDVVRIVDATGRTVHVESAVETTTIQYRPATAGLYVLVIAGTMGTRTTPILVLQ
jgi:hypothetical protein